MAKIQHYAPNSGLRTIARREFEAKQRKAHQNAINAIHAMAGAPMRIDRSPLVDEPFDLVPQQPVVSDALHAQVTAFQIGAPVQVANYEGAPHAGCGRITEIAPEVEYWGFVVLVNEPDGTCAYTTAVADELTEINDNDVPAVVEDEYERIHAKLAY